MRAVPREAVLPHGAVFGRSKHTPRVRSIPKGMQPSTADRCQGRALTHKECPPSSVLASIGNVLRPPRSPTVDAAREGTAGGAVHGAEEGSGKEMARRYERATRTQKTLMLDELCALTRWT